MPEPTPKIPPDLRLEVARILVPLIRERREAKAREAAERKAEEAS